jgi:outer membrane lipoprotein-sorting protein
LRGGFKFGWSKEAYSMTTFAAVLRSASVLVLLSGLSLAQDATAILKSVGETYSALKSYEFQGATTAVTTTGKIVSTSEETFTVIFSAPDQFVVEFRYPGQGSWTRASNGKTTTEIRTATKEFAQQPTTQYDIRILDNSPIGWFYSMDTGNKNAAVEGSENVSVDGQDVDCWVISTEREMGMLPEGVKRAPTKLWVDKARFLVLRQVSGTESVATGNKATKNVRTMRITHAQLGQTIAPDLFQPRSPKKK